MPERVFPISFFLIALMLGGCAETLLYLEQEKSAEQAGVPNSIEASISTWAGSDILINSESENFILGKNIFKADKVLPGHQTTLVPQIDELEDSGAVEPVEPIEPAGHKDRCWGTGRVKRCISKNRVPANWLDMSPEDVVQR